MVTNMIDWCESCKHNETERDSMFPCIVCERAHDNSPSKWESNDYVRVVRCKDCRHYHKRDDYNPLQMKTHCKMTGLATDDDDYCSYGVRKE